MYDTNNIFNKIISGKIPSEKIYEDDQLIAIKDINPMSPIHLLVIPKANYKDFDDFTKNATSEEIVHYFKTVSNIAKENGATEYRIMSNIGASAGQTIFHFHTHVLSEATKKR